MQFPITAIREIKILKKLQHENVIKLKEIVTSPGFYPSPDVQSGHLAHKHRNRFALLLYCLNMLYSFLGREVDEQGNPGN